MHVFRPNPIVSNRLIVLATAAVFTGVLALDSSAQLVGGGAVDPGPETCVSLSDRITLQSAIKRKGAPLGWTYRKQLPSTPLYTFYPVAGTLFGDLFLTNYVDLDSNGNFIGEFDEETEFWVGVADGEIHTFDGTDWAYDGHGGQDAGPTSFIHQNVGIPIYAVTDGVVFLTIDGHPDMNTSAEGQPSNLVVIDHGNGHGTFYFHLKKDSVSVSEGQVVKAGQQIGLLGSSGNSTGPHLHFARWENLYPTEPNAGPGRPGPSGWTNQVPLPTETYIREFGFSTVDIGGTIPNQLVPTSPQVPFGVVAPIYFWVYIGVLPGGSTWKFEIITPDGTPTGELGTSTGTFPISGFARQSVWYYSHTPPIGWPLTGTWKIQYSVNGKVMLEAPFEVVDTIDPSFNRPPESAILSLEPEDPKPDDVVVCRVDAPLPLDDLDYDVVSYRYLWTVDGVVVRDNTNAARSDAIPRNSAENRTTLQCTVIPTDGKDNGPVSTIVSVASAQANRSGFEIGDSLTLTIPFLPGNAAVQWFKGVTPLTDDARIMGANTPTLTISPLNAGDSGIYTALYDDGSKGLTETFGPIDIGVVMPPPTPAHSQPWIVACVASIGLLAGFIVLRRRKME